MAATESWTRAYIGIGSNLGDRRAAIENALALLRAEPGVELESVSNLYETEPEGGPPQGPFLNTAACVRTCLSPRGLLQTLARIETKLGRVRVERWGPRTIDLDLLLFGEAVIDSPDLVVPHPRLTQRRFVLEPLAEIAGDVRHPLTGKTIREHRDLRRKLGGSPSLLGARK